MFGTSCKDDPIELSYEVSYDVTPIIGDAPLNVTAKAEVISGDVSTFSWNFGDGSAPQTGRAAAHTYTQQGVYMITLTVTGKEGTDQEPLDVEKTYTQQITVNAPLIAPNAKFSYSPSFSVIADQRIIYFDNLSTGSIDNYAWHFGHQEGISSTTHPSYIFDTEGYKTVELIASGPLGNDTETKTIQVHAMEPSCNNYGDNSTQSTSRINNLRNNGSLQVGEIIIKSNYANPVQIRLFHPDEWSEGKYTPFGNYYWEVESGETTKLILSATQNLYIGNDWGIQIRYSNGVESCIRIVDKLSNLNNGQYTIEAKDIYDG